MRPRILFVLQNAWRRTATPGERWDGAGWERRMWRSQTGKRLREMIPTDVDYAVTNATPVASNRCEDVLPPDADYVLGRIKDWRPHLVVLLGISAQTLTPLIDLPILHVPHPCYRLLSKQQTAEIATALRVAAFAALAGEPDD